MTPTHCLIHGRSRVAFSGSLRACREAFAHKANGDAYTWVIVPVEHAPGAHVYILTSPGGVFIEACVKAIVAHADGYRLHVVGVGEHNDREWRAARPESVLAMTLEAAA